MFPFADFNPQLLSQQMAKNVPVINRQHLKTF